MTTPEHRAPEGGPVRVQLSRAKGWRMPENTVRVDRITKWGNPFKVGEDHSYYGGPGAKHASAEQCVALYRQFLIADRGMMADLQNLRGKNLACWCKPGAPCHADVLLEIANRPVCEAVPSPTSEKTDD